MIVARSLKTSYRWIIVFLLWLSHLLFAFGSNSIGPLAPLFKAEFDLNSAQIGMLTSSIYIGGTVAQIPVGLICDRIGPKKIVGLGVLMLGTSIFWFSYSESFLLCAILLFVFGVGYGCCQSPASKAIMNWFSFKGRATAMGIKQTGVNVGAILASIALPAITLSYNWRISLRVFGFFSFIFSFFIYFLLKDSPTERIVDKTNYITTGLRSSSFWDLIKSDKFMKIGLIGIFLMATQTSFSTYWILYLTKSLNYNITVAGGILGLTFAIGALARIGWSIVSDYVLKDREKLLVLIGIIGFAACSFSAILPGSISKVPIFLAAFFFGISGIGWNSIWLTLVGEFFGQDFAGLGTGVAFVVANIGVILGPPFFGLLVDLTKSFFFAWIFLAICMILVTFLSRSMKIDLRQI